MSSTSALIVTLLGLFAMCQASGSGSGSGYLDAQRYWGQCLQVRSIHGRDGVRLESASRNSQATNQLAIKDFNCAGAACQKAKSCDNSRNACLELVSCSRNERCVELVIVGCNGLPVRYDGNGDGIPDEDQRDAMSAIGVIGFVTVSSDHKKNKDKFKINNVTVSDPGSVDVGGILYDLPLGAVHFSAKKTRKEANTTFKIFYNPSNPAICSTPHDILKLINGVWTKIGPSDDAFFPKANNYCFIKIKILDNGPWDMDPKRGRIADPIAIGDALGSGDQLA